jgi:O-acetyl-ADP-ribose deacetylase (regulator of RNase III)
MPRTQTSRIEGARGAIFKAADAVKLQTVCDKLSPIKTFVTVITLGFNLPAKYFIHSTANTARNNISVTPTRTPKNAVENKCESIAFPLISSCVYDYPKADALRVEAAAIQAFIREHDIDVRLMIFDNAAFEVSAELLGVVESYIG